MINEITRLTALLSWCSHNGFDIDTRLQVVTRDGEPSSPGRSNRSNWSVLHSGPSSIPPGTSVARIPRHAILSTRSCALSSVIPHVPYGIGAQLCLALALYSEMLIGDKSYWSKYIQSLPTEQVQSDLPYFWDMQDTLMVSDEKVDKRVALSWIRGLDLEKELKNAASGLTISDEVTKYYTGFAEPLLHGHVSVNASLNGFISAFSCVSSRAFVVDAFHGLSMVPIADINHVHLESEYDVCTVCGSVQECLHDKEADYGFLHPSDEHSDVYYEMITNTVIEPLSEVYNTYGDTLTNAQLLSRYGFILDANENDRVSWGVQELLSEMRTTDFGYGVSPDEETIYSSWNCLMQLDSTLSSLRQLASQSSVIYYDGLEPRSLHIDAEGRVSLSLWCFSVLFGLHVSGLAVAETVQSKAAIFGLIHTQLLLEDPDGVEEAVLADIQNKRELAIPLSRGAQCIIYICDSRRKKLAGPDVDDPGVFLDSLPDNMTRTKAVFALLLSELAILSTCRHNWSETLASILPDQ